MLMKLIKWYFDCLFLQTAHSSEDCPSVQLSNHTCIRCF